MQLAGVTTPSILSPAFFGLIAAFDDVIVSLHLSGATSTLPRKTFEKCQNEQSRTIRGNAAWPMPRWRHPAL
jgi:ABC-type spermidine/putrescine transport system permease subunit II